MSAIAIPENMKDTKLNNNIRVRLTKQLELVSSLQEKTLLTGSNESALALSYATSGLRDLIQALADAEAVDADETCLENLPKDVNERKEIEEAVLRIMNEQMRYGGNLS